AQHAKLVEVGAAIGFVPELVPIRIRTHDPIIVVTVAGGSLVAARPRVGGVTAEDESAITRLSNYVENVFIRRAEGFIPQLIAVGVCADDPKIVTAEVGAALVARCTRVRVGKATENKTTVAGLLQAPEPVIVG